MRARGKRKRRKKKATRGENEEEDAAAQSELGLALFFPPFFAHGDAGEGCEALSKKDDGGLEERELLCLRKEELPIHAPNVRAAASLFQEEEIGSCTYIKGRV